MLLAQVTDDQPSAYAGVGESKKDKNIITAKYTSRSAKSQEISREPTENKVLLPFIVGKKMSPYLFIICAIAIL